MDYCQAKGGRCGGIIDDLEGQQEIEYAWGLGTSTNNKVESSTIYQGLIMLIKKGVCNTSMVIYSSTIIRSLFHQTLVHEFRLPTSLKGLHWLVIAQNMNFFKFYEHTTRGLISKPI
jgi:ribonuclease HI